MLHDRGHIYKGVYEGWYSMNDEAFLSPLDVEEHMTTDGQTVMVNTQSLVFCLCYITSVVLSNTRYTEYVLVLLTGVQGKWSPCRLGNRRELHVPFIRFL